MNYMARISEFVKTRWAKGEELDPEVEKMFWDNLGQTPMCCVKMDIPLVGMYPTVTENEKKKVKIKCDRVTGDGMSKEDFRKFCLDCQVKIAVILFRKQTEGKKVKDYTEDEKRKLNKTGELIVSLRECCS